MAQSCCHAMVLSLLQGVSAMLLNEVGIAHEVELKTQDGFFSIDCAFESNGLMVALEVDGPLHFTVNTNRQLGHTALRSPPHPFPPPPCLSYVLPFSPSIAAVCCLLHDT